jgi:hypothetical protein
VLAQLGGARAICSVSQRFSGSGSQGASAGQSRTSRSQSGSATTKGSTPSMRNMRRQVVWLMMKPESGWVMIEAMARLVIQKP